LIALAISGGIVFIRSHRRPRGFHADVISIKSDAARKRVNAKD